MAYMKTLRNTFTAAALITAFILGSAALADAQKRSDKETRDILRSLDSKIDDFNYHLDYQLRSSSAGHDTISEMSDEIRGLSDALSEFQRAFDLRRENRDDANRLMVPARRLNDFLARNPQNRQIEDDWTTIRGLLDRLGGSYGVTANWSVTDDTQNPQWVKDDRDPSPVKSTSVGLSGTYDLDKAKSERVDDIVADTNLGNDQKQDLRDKLDAPEQIAIDIRGTQVTLATSNAAPVTFTADGREKTEQSPSGKTLRLRASLNGDVLTVSSLGGETDYTITFTSMSGGQVMKVSRRITTDYLNQTVFAESIYNKSDAVARLGIRNGGTNDPNGTYSDNDQTGTVSNGGSPGSNGGVPSAVNVRPGNYTVPNGTVLSGTLETEINTKYSQNNDRFRLTVLSPDEYRGATIEGYITGINRSGKVTGQSKLTFTFEKITLRNGRTYDLAGSLQSVLDQTGKIIKVDNEGTVSGTDQTKQTVKRGSIGAGIGAVIGAIAGGVKGAVIGGVLGGGAGAGSVAIQNQGDIELQRGSTITLQAAAPQQQNPR
jgi:hypothetical protein